MNSDTQKIRHFNIQKEIYNFTNRQIKKLKNLGNLKNLNK